MSKKLFTVAVFVIALIFAVSYFGQQQSKNRGVLKVYVPCGLTIPFKELSLAYEARNHALKVENTFDNTNVLVKLILHQGKTPDIFISPGKKEITLLKDKGLIDEGSLVTLGSYSLILIAPQQSDKIKGLEDLLKPEIKTIALANPNFNSVGYYAQEALSSLGLWDKIKDKFVFTNTPIEALSFIATSKADAGIHYDACPFQTNADTIAQGAIKVVSTLPANSYQPIYNYIGILKASPNKAVAKSYIDFMLSKKGSAILTQHGLGKISPAGASATQAQEKPRVILEAYYPFNEEHLFMKDYLESLPMKYQGKLKVECIDFRVDEGYVRWRKTGLSCGGILINGKTKFTVNLNGQPKEVEFLKRLDMFWTKEDLEAAIQQELAKAQW